MSSPTKILPFVKPIRIAVIDDVTGADDEFPRLHREQLRVPFTGRPIVVGFGIPPLTSK